MDSANQLAGAKRKYTKRLNKIAKTLGNNIDGTPDNYKVYMTSNINVWAIAKASADRAQHMRDRIAGDKK